MPGTHSLDEGQLKALELAWPHKLSSKHWLKAQCDIFYDFDWFEVMNHNRPTFQGLEDLTKSVNEFSSQNRKKPILVLSTKSDVRFLPIMGEEIYIAIINIDEYRQALGKSTRSGQFFLKVLADAMPVNGDIRIAQLLAKLKFSLSSDEVDLNNVLSGDIVEVISKLVQTFASTISTDKDNEQLIQLADRLALESQDALYDLAVISNRRQTVKEFQNQLDRNEWHEKQWQKFFNLNPWLLGSAGDLLFLDMITSEAEVRSSNIYRKGKRNVDFLMKSVGTSQFTKVVEVKLPSQALVTHEYRNGIYLMSEHVIGGISQTLAYARNLETSIMGQPNIGAFTVRPQGILIVGNLNSIKLNIGALESFEEFRSAQHGVTIVTYDELLERAMHFAGNSFDSDVYALASARL